jgi:SAM-dependent methyltransferase
MVLGLVNGHDPTMDGFELYDLGRKLVTIGDEAIPDPAGIRRLPSGVRLILTDVCEHPGTSITDITERTGLPPSHIEASVATLRDAGALATTVDPDDQGRTRFRPVPLYGAADRAASPVDGRLAAAAGIQDPDQLKELVITLETLVRRLTGALAPDQFNARYAGTPPWDTGRPQPALLQLAESGAISGRVLEAGCGTGEHTLMAAALGLPALGIDPASAAIAIAQRKARERDLPARFLVRSAFDLGDLDEQFDTVLDSGLFHVFGDEEQSRYVDSLTTVTRPGARLFLSCFSDRQPPGNGPRRVSQDEIRARFADGWRVDTIESSIIDNNNHPDGILGWLATITRI